MLHKCNIGGCKQIFLIFQIEIEAKTWLDDDDGEDDERPEEGDRPRPEAAAQAEPTAGGSGTPMDE